MLNTKNDFWKTMSQELLQTKKSPTLKSVRIDLIMHNDMNNSTKQNEAFILGFFTAIIMSFLSTNNHNKQALVLSIGVAYSKYILLKVKKNWIVHKSLPNARLFKYDKLIIIVQLSCTETERDLLSKRNNLGKPSHFLSQRYSSTAGEISASLSPMSF